MVSKVQICNMALSAIGNDTTMADYNENTKAARTCRTWFDTCIGSLLQDFPWNFSIRFVPLALSAETVPGYSTIYAKPSDCITINQITDAAGARIGGNYRWGGVFATYGGVFNQISKIPYKVFAGTQQELIACDLAGAYAAYTALIDDTERYPPMFVECLALRLGSAIAMPMSASADVLSRISQSFSQRIGDAKAAVMNEEQQDPEAITASLGARW